MITVLITLAVTAIVGFVAGRLTDHEIAPTIDSQLADIRIAASRAGASVTIRPATLHGLISYIVVLRHEGNGFATSGISDQLEIYDVEAGRLLRRFRFEPAPLGHQGWQYRLIGATDLESSGEEEVIGGFSQLIDTGGEEVAVPVIVAWDDAVKRYVLQPLAPDPPLVQVPATHYGPVRSVAGEDWWRIERYGATLRDVHSGAAIHGFGGADFAVEPVASYRAPETTGAVLLEMVVGVNEIPRAVLSAWLLSPTLPPVRVTACPASHPYLTFDVAAPQIHLERAFGSSATGC